MSRRYAGEQFIFNGATATGTGQGFVVPDFMHLFFTLSSASNANFTIKFQGSYADTMPDFSSAQSNTNRWDYIQVRDMQNNSAIDGDTGVAFAGTDDVRQFEANVNGLKWICATITARSAGAISLRLQAFSNE
jgi:hypothetical protein